MSRPQAYPSSYAMGLFDRSEEEWRVLYVALTRAKDELIITRHAPNGSEGYALWAHSNQPSGDDLIGELFPKLASRRFGGRVCSLSTAAVASIRRRYSRLARRY
jgi:ATP-dependent exoDNAse (exonuclease V) beta subunit